MSGSEVSSPVMGSMVTFPVCASVAMNLCNTVDFWNLFGLEAVRVEVNALESTRGRNSDKDIAVQGDSTACEMMVMVFLLWWLDLKEKASESLCVWPTRQRGQRVRILDRFLPISACREI